MTENKVGRFLSWLKSKKTIEPLASLAICPLDTLSANPTKPSWYPNPWARLYRTRFLGHTFALRGMA